MGLASMRTSISGSRAVNDESRGISQRVPNEGTTVTCTTRRPGRTRSAASGDGAQAVARSRRATLRPGVGVREAAAVRVCVSADAEMRFEHAQLLADRGGRHRELVGRGAHRSQPRHGIEGTHGIQRGQAHRGSGIA